MLVGGMVAQATQADGVRDDYAKKQTFLVAPKKGFICAAIASGLRLRMQTAELVEKNLSETRGQISAMLRWTLPQAQLSKAAEGALLRRMNEFLVPTDHYQRVMAYTFRGEQQIEDFLSELQRSSDFYKDLIKNSGDPSLLSEQVTTGALLVGVTLGASVFFVGAVQEWQNFVSGFPQDLDLARTVLASLGLGYGLSEFWGVMQSFISDRDQAFLQFKKRVSLSLSSPAAAAPLQVFSYDYLLLPETFNEASDRGMLSVPTIASELKERPYGSRVSLRRFLGLNRIGSYYQGALTQVSVDLVFEAGDVSGEHGYPAMLHVLVRGREQDRGDGGNKRKKRKEPVVAPVFEGKLAPVTIRR